MGAERFRYDGKRVLVVGGATGMGAAAAQLAGELGGELTVLDVVDVDYPVKRALRLDLADAASIDAALAELDGPYDAMFSCAGVSDPNPQIMKINFIGQRCIIDTLEADGRLGPGSAVAMISSIGGSGWRNQIPEALDFLANDTWESMNAWVDAHEGTNNYVFSKVAMNTYVSSRAFPYAQKNMRINAIMPGGTDTPLARKHAEMWLPFQGDYREATGKPHLTPQQMGDTLAFLCMDAASGINGCLVTVDDGYVPSTITGSFESPVVKMMLGI
jgi:NAD(P)-dependent dehydrogenase (short-subunit alcohol dehydrogenase family)